MRVIPKARRDRLALFYALLAAGLVLAGVVGGGLADPSAYSWILLLAGLIGYVFCARLAMLLWQGRRTIPRPPRVRLHAVAAAVLALATLRGAANAQQAIFNVPNADVLEKGEACVEVDHTYRPSDPSFQTFALRGVTGIGRAVEAGSNFGFVDSGRSVPTASPNLKWQPYTKAGLTVTTGAFGLFCLRGSEDGDPAALGYGHVAYRFPRARKSLMAGAWGHLLRVRQSDAEGGGLFGFEQPLGDCVTLAADWFTGENSLGYFTPGLIATARNLTTYASYSFKNGHSRGTILTELGFTF